MSAPLSTNLNDPDAVPYFVWDQPMTVAEIRSRLETSPEADQIRLLGKILREARDTDVWYFTTPAEVVRLWDKLSPHLGKRRSFWEFILDRWQSEGLLDN